MRCQEFREMFDSYLGDELLIETNHEVLRHLENCPACRQELSARRDLRMRLRFAAKNASDAQINPAFAARLRNDLQAAALRPTFFEKFKANGIFGNTTVLATAFGLFLLIFGGWFVLRSTSVSNDSAQSNRANQTTQPAESPMVQAVQIAWRELTEHAVGDHKNCALQHNLTEAPITLDETAARYGKYNKDLDKTVFTSLREVFGEKGFGKIEFLEAHSCVFDGRRFAHVVLRHRGKTISVLVTDTDLPAENGDVFNSQSDETMRVNGFRTAHHAVFVVSDLTEQENATITGAILPAVSRHIEKTGA